MLIRCGAALILACGLAGAAAPFCSLVPGWSQKGEARSYEADNLFEYMDGNAEGYVIYGFQNMHGVTCEKAGITLVIDISDFGDDDSSYGMFSANRDPRQPGTRLGMGGQIVPRRAVFTKGRYYVEIAANPEGDFTTTLQEWTAAIERSVEGATTPPAALRWFPKEKLQSLRLVPESVLGIRLLKRGYVGQYEFGKAFVVQDEGGAALMQKLRTRFGDTSPATIGDEAFQMTDPYLGRLCIFRKGRFIAGYANVADGNDPAALASALASHLP